MIRATIGIAFLCVGLLVCGCEAVPRGGDSARVVVFVLDSPMDMEFVEGRAAEVPQGEVSHGSLVGRVVRRYTRAELVAVPVEQAGGAIGGEAYLAGLRRVLRFQENHPEARVVVNISLASPERDPVEEELILRIVENGGLVVAAAGNEDTDEPMYPAGYEPVIAVANATKGGKALSSNYGPHVDIAASGDITFIDYAFLPYERLRREMEARGTSFAAPRVAATLAWLMGRTPGLTPREAWRIVRTTARPIDGRLFEQGLLGAGLLNIYAAKATVAPAFRFLHYVLPAAIWLVLGVVSVYMWLRYGLPGVFLSLIMWLVALPVTVLLVIKSARYLELVGEGSLLRGLGAVAVLAGAGVFAAGVQDWNPVKTALALLIPYSVFGALPAFQAIDVHPVAGALVAGAAGMIAAVAWEFYTLSRLELLEKCPGPAAPWSSVEDLLRTYRWSLDPRLRAAALRALGRMGGEEAIDFLLHEPRRPELAEEALAEAARRDVGAFADWLRRFDELSQEERDRIDTALIESGNPQAEFLLEQIAHSHPSPGLEKLLSALRYPPEGA